jgi:hypothetical protein
MFLDGSEMGTDGRGAHDGTVGRGEQGEELEERGRNEMERMTDACIGRGYGEEDRQSF